MEGVVMNLLACFESKGNEVLGSEKSVVADVFPAI